MIKNVDEIKKQANVESILHTLGAINLKGNGNELRANCPIADHRKSPQCFSIDTSTKQYFCHAGCEGGDVFKLVEKVKNVSFAEAVNFVAECSGTDVGTFQPATKQPWPTQQKKSIVGRTPQQVLDNSSVQGNHPYLIDKCVDACPGLYFGKDEKGNDAVIVPFRNVQNELQTVQFVHTNGKYFLGGHQSGGAFFTIGTFKDGDEVLLAEGLATADTIWMSLDKIKTVISFGSANNMVKVVAALKSKYSSLKIIICLDNSDAAFKQAGLINPLYGCSFRVPSFEGLTSQNPDKGLADFNDLISKCGQNITVVREQLMIEKTINDLPIPKKELMAEAALKASDKPTYGLSSAIQKEVLNYLMRHSFEEVVSEGFGPENFRVSLFTGILQDVMKGIIETWESGKPVTISEISLQSGDNANRVYEELEAISKQAPINAKQLPDRLNKLSDDSARSKLNSLLQEIQHSNEPLCEITSKLPKKINEIMGSSKVILPQSHYLHALVDEIKNPKNKPIETGFKSFDRLMGGGFIRAELGILAGGAGAGKTAFALQVADSLALNGACVVYFSIEVGRRKLTERSLKRLSYIDSAQQPLTEFDKILPRYEKFAENIFLLKGHHGQLVSEIRLTVLSIRQSRPNQEIVLFIDPFQRLGTGDDKMDSNETMKVGKLISQIKDMAEELDIPILVLSDTNKSHKDDPTGEQSVRGSYNANHTGDYIMMLRASRDPLVAIYGKKNHEDDDDPFLPKIKEELKRPIYANKEGRYSLKSDWHKYASLVTSKVRDSGKFSPLFVYRPEYHLFEDIDLWDNVFKVNK